MATSIDRSLSWRTVGDRLTRTENPRHRKMLQTLADHLRAEEHQSLELLLATLVPEPSYHLWKNGADYGPKGAAAVRQYYTELVESKRGILEYAIERIVVDDDNIVTEGTIRAY
jgi:predicted YcjX-like family ATPase